MYRHSVKDDYDQCHQCYVTVCAGPSLRPCPDCNYGPLSGITDKCLKHSFVVHFKYDLMPPFPMFNPSISLKMQDTVLFNTGDFLMALKVSTFDKNSSLMTESFDFCGDQQTELFCKMCDKAPVSIAISNQYSAVTEVDRSHAADKDSENQACGGISGTHHAQTHLREESSSADSENTKQGDSNVNEIHAGKQQLDRQKVVLGFVRELYVIHGECINSHQVNDREYLLTPRETFDEKDAKVHSEISAEVNGLLPVDGQTNQSSNKSESNELTEKFVSRQTSELSCCSKDEIGATKTVCSIVTEVSSRSAVHGSLKDSSLPDIDSKSNCNLGAEYCTKVVDSCSCGHNAVVPTTNNNLTLSVLKIYADPDNGDLGELPDRSDEFDMYDGSLAVSVKTCHGKTLKQIDKINQNSPRMAPSKLQYHTKVSYHPLTRGQTLRTLCASRHSQCNPCSTGCDSHSATKTGSIMANFLARI